MTRNGTNTNALVELWICTQHWRICGFARGFLTGKETVPILSNPKSSGKKYAYTVVSRGAKLGRSIRTNNWRYAEWGESALPELYNSRMTRMSFQTLQENRHTKFNWNN